LGCEGATLEGESPGAPSSAPPSGRTMGTQAAANPGVRARAGATDAPTKPTRLAERGPVLGTELARAIGVGACARLATDVGVDWAAPGAARKLEVRAKVSATMAEVSLKVGDREASGTGATPVDAIAAATAALAKQLSPPAMSPAQIALW